MMILATVLRAGVVKTSLGEGETMAVEELLGITRYRCNRSFNGRDRAEAAEADRWLEQHPMGEVTVKELYEVFVVEHPKGLLVPGGYTVDPDEDPKLILGPVYVFAPSPYYASVRVTKEQAELLKEVDTTRMQVIVGKLGPAVRPTNG
jgi:hypothetical protein